MAEVPDTTTTKTPVEALLETVQWNEREAEVPATGDSDLPWVTHEGVLEIGVMKLRCYRLSNGQVVFNADDFREFFGFEFL